MSANDDDKLLAKLAELRKRRAEAAKLDGAPAPLQAAASSAGDRASRLQALRGKRVAVASNAEGDAPAGQAGEGQRGAILRRLMAKRAGGAGEAGQGEADEGQRGAALRRFLANRKNNNAEGGPGDAGGGGDGKGREFLKRALARRQGGGADGASPGVAGSGEGDLVRLLMRRIGNESKTAITPEDKQKAREKIEKLISDLKDRLNQLDAENMQASADPKLIESKPVADTTADNKRKDPADAKRGGGATK